MTEKDNNIKWGIIVLLILFVIFPGLYIALISGHPYGLLITGIGSVLTVMIFIRFSDDKKKARDSEIAMEIKTDEESKKTISTTITPSKLKWENYSNVEKAFKLLGILVILFGLSYVIWIGLSASEPFMGIGIIGLGSFVVVLAGAFCLSDKWNLHAGEFRKALTISIISVYFASLAFSNKIVTTNVTSNGTNLTNIIGSINSSGASNVITIVNSTGTSKITQWTMVEPVFNNLWAIVITIIAFYFAQNWIELYKKNK